MALCTDSRWGTSLSLAGDGLGLKVVGGREIPGTNMIGAYIQKIHPSLSMNEIREGSLHFVLRFMLTGLTLSLFVQVCK